MKIYTRAGDKGLTSLFGGSRVSKTDLRLDAYGGCDELNSLLGWALTEIRQKEALRDLSQKLQQIQAELFQIGSRLACDNANMRQKLDSVGSNETKRLESEIDQMSDSLPALKTFILPGGSESAARLHIVRTASRHAERAVLRFYESCDESDENIMAYLNRISDYFFTAARYSNHQLGFEDIPWTGR